MPASNQSSGMLKPAQASSYIVTAANEENVRHVYGSLGVTLLRSLGHGLFEMQLKNNPGLAAVSKLANDSNGLITAVQPNFTYQAN